MKTLVDRNERVGSAYWRFVLSRHVEDSEALQAAYSAGWSAGGKQVLRDSAELAGLVPVLRELVAWLNQEADE